MKLYLVSVYTPVHTFSLLFQLQFIDLLFTFVLQRGLCAFQSLALVRFPPHVFLSDNVIDKGGFILFPPQTFKELCFQYTVIWIFYYIVSKQLHLKQLQ